MCLKKFDTPTQRNNHHLETHSGLRVKCPVCAKNIAPRGKNLAEHIKKMHSDYNPPDSLTLNKFCNLEAKNVLKSSVPQVVPDSKEKEERKHKCDVSSFQTIFKNIFDILMYM